MKNQEYWESTRPIEGLFFCAIDNERLVRPTHARLHRAGREHVLESSRHVAPGPTFRDGAVLKAAPSGTAPAPRDS